MKAEIPTILDRILEKKRLRIDGCKRRRSLGELRSRIADLAGPSESGRLGQALEKTGVRIIAEFKRCSPSRGIIRDPFEIEEIHRAYEEGGADAYSVLTEEDFFKGSLADLESLRGLTEKPILRKDFIFDEYQIYEARVAGADAVLLIAAILERKEIQHFLRVAGELGLDCLVEVHNESELQEVLKTEARIIGVNNRDLHTFEVDLHTTARLARSLPEGSLVVSESGIRGAEDIRFLASTGTTAFLIGEHLMRSQDAATTLRDLKEAL